MVNAAQKTLEGPPPFEVSINVAFPETNEPAEKLDTGFSLFVAQAALQDMLLTCLISYLKQITSNLEGDDRLAGLNVVSRLQAILKRARSSRNLSADHSYKHVPRCRITLDPGCEVSPKSDKRSVHEEVRPSLPVESIPVPRRRSLLESASTTSVSSPKGVKESSDSKRADHEMLRDASDKLSIDLDIPEESSGDQCVGRRLSMVHFDLNADLNASPDKDLDRQVSTESAGSQVSKASSDDGVTDIKIKMAKRIAREMARDDSPRVRSSSEPAPASFPGIGELHKDGLGRRLSMVDYVSEESTCPDDEVITDIKIAMAKRLREKSKDPLPRAKFSSDGSAASVKEPASGRQWTKRTAPRSQTGRPPEMTASDFATDEDHFTHDLPTKAGQIQPTPTFHRLFCRTASH